MPHSLPKGTWTAAQAISWAMFGDETVLASWQETDPELAPGGQVPKIRAYTEVVHTLREAVSREEIEAKGFQDGRSSSERQVIPGDLFQRYPELIVDGMGVTTFTHPRHDPAFKSPPAAPISRWTHIVFKEAQIRALSPDPKAELWMRRHIRDKSKTRTDLIAACQHATSCSGPVAKAAYKAANKDMPDADKRKAGRPRAAK